MAESRAKIRDVARVFLKDFVLPVRDREEIRRSEQAVQGYHAAAVKYEFNRNHMREFMAEVFMAFGTPYEESKRLASLKATEVMSAWEKLPLPTNRQIENLQRVLTKYIENKQFRTVGKYHEVDVDMALREVKKIIDDDMAILVSEKINRQLSEMSAAVAQMKSESEAREPALNALADIQAAQEKYAAQSKGDPKSLHGQKAAALQHAYDVLETIWSEDYKGQYSDAKDFVAKIKKEISVVDPKAFQAIGTSNVESVILKAATSIFAALTAEQSQAVTPVIAGRARQDSLQGTRGALFDHGSPAKSPSAPPAIDAGASVSRNPFDEPKKKSTNPFDDVDTTPTPKTPSPPAASVPVSKNPFDEPKKKSTNPFDDDTTPAPSRPAAPGKAPGKTKSG